MNLTNSLINYAAAPRYLFRANRKAIESFFLKERVQGVMQCAAYTDVDQAESDETKAISINAQIPNKIAIIARDLNIPFIHFSSEAVFSGKGSGFYREDDTPDPLSIYGKSKLLGDAMVLASNSSSFIFRLSWLYSLRRKNNFVSRIVPRLLGGEEVAVVGDVFGNPAPAEYVANMVHLAMIRNILPGIYNLGSSNRASKFHLASAIAINLGLPRNRVREIKRADFPTPAPRSGDASLNISKFESSCGISLTTWEELLQESMTDGCQRA